MCGFHFQFLSMFPDCCLYSCNPRELYSKEKIVSLGELPPNGKYIPKTTVSERELYPKENVIPVRKLYLEENCLVSQRELLAY